MKLLVDAIGVRPGSAAIVIGHTLDAWTRLAPDDQITVLVDGEPQFPVPRSATVKPIAEGSAGMPRRLWAQSVGVRRESRRLEADALLSAVTAGGLLGASCPHGVILHDLRHELRPLQFSSARRLSRRLLYGWSFMRVDFIFCVSARTRDDLVRRRPRIRSKAYVALLGGDHVDRWPSATTERPYVLAFGHFPNKNVDGVLDAWRTFSSAHREMRLRISGLGPAARTTARARAARLGIEPTVELLPWLYDDEFEATFAAAAAVLFPSDFEGFGLPALEALRLGIPVVISSDPALLEVTGGHAVVATGERADELADALERALALTPEQLASGVAHARAFTWERTAATIRGVLARQAQMPVSST